MLKSDLARQLQVRNSSHKAVLPNLARNRVVGRAVLCAPGRAQECPPCLEPPFSCPGSNRQRTSAVQDQSKFPCRQSSREASWSAVVLYLFSCVGKAALHK